MIPVIDHGHNVIHPKSAAQPRYINSTTSVWPSADFYYNGASVEDLSGYKPGGYHPVHLGDSFSTIPSPNQPKYGRQKLGYGSFSTVWLAEDLSRAK
jgi:hypothetical protein